MNIHKITVIGHGNVGGTLAKRWADAGHTVTIGARDPKEVEDNSLAKNNGITIADIPSSVETADIILVAIPSQATAELAQSLPNLNGKIIIDATNAVMKGPDPYETGYHAFEDLTKATVVKSFNSTGFENMKDPVYGDHHLDMFMAGDDENAKEVVRQLALDIGFENCYDFGGGEKVVLLEKFALSWINLAIMQGVGRNIGFKVLHR